MVFLATLRVRAAEADFRDFALPPLGATFFFEEALLARTERGLRRASTKAVAALEAT